MTSYAYVIFDKRPRTSNGDLTTGSAEDGTFCFRGVGSGQYFLSASKPGFLDADYGSGNYLQAGSVLPVDSAPLRGLAVTLDPMSGIGGRVVDDFGDAVANANVVAVKQVWFHGRRVSMPVQGSQSDERGVYRIGRLTPGAYYVYAQLLPFSAQGMTGAGPARTLIRTYYPAALAAADAALISVPVGEDVSDIDVRMVRARTYHVRGRVDGPPEFRVGGTVRLLPEGEEPMALVFGAGHLNTDGSFDFGGVGPGMYTLAFQSQAGASRLPVELGETDVFVTVPVVPNASIHGRVVVAASTRAGAVRMPEISLSAADTVLGPTIRVNVDGKGEMSATQILPGRYFLRAQAPPGEYISSVRSGTTDLVGRELDVSGGGTVEITVVVRQGSATVVGAVEEDGQSQGSAEGPEEIVLIRSAAAVDGSGLYFAATDAAGRFTVRDVAPGRYRLAVLPTLEVRLFQNPVLLKDVADSGTDVDIGEMESKRLSVSPMPVDAVGRLLTLADSVR